MTEAELEAIRERMDGLRVALTSTNPSLRLVPTADQWRSHRKQDVENLAALLSEVERLRGVVKAGKEAHRRDLISRYSGFDHAWENHLEFAKAYCPLCQALEEGE